MFEFDFNGSAFARDPAQTANSVAPRHADAILGPWLVGQTYPFLYDTSAFPDVLDFGDDQDAGASRQPQIRYTANLPSYLNYLNLPADKFAVELMNPHSDAAIPLGRFGANKITGFTSGVANPAGGFMNPLVNRPPDVTLGLELNCPVYHMRCGAIIRPGLRFDAGAFGPKKDFIGYGVSGCGSDRPQPSPSNLRRRDWYRLCHVAGKLPDRPMIEIIKGLPDKVIGIVASGPVTERDRDRVLLPELKKS